MSLIYNTLPHLYDCSKEVLMQTVSACGAKSYAAGQLYQWLYEKCETDFSKMLNLSQELRKKLSEKYSLQPISLSKTETAMDGTEKFLFELEDGKTVETVLIAMGNDRRTLCVSTQVGCAMGCRFCRTATMGLIRHLRQSEILGQVIGVRRLRPEIPFTNIVLMGMGEPLHNYEAVVGALKILTDPKGLKIGKRHVTLSTVGLSPLIKKLGEEKLGIKLALSLHATTDALRQKLIPIARKYPLQEVLEACHSYCKAQGPRTLVTFEYLLIKDINDSAEDAARLIAIASKIPSKVNVIPLNPYPGCPWERPTEAGLKNFVDRLREKKIQVNIRISRGQEILAACGQLATQKV